MGIDIASSAGIKVFVKKKKEEEMLDFWVIVLKQNIFV
jgi:hypothetical protein